MKRPLWAAALIGAAVFVLLDVAVLAVVGGMTASTGSPLSSALQTWMSFHLPAFTLAGLFLAEGSDLPGPSSAGSWAVVAALVVAEAAILGACVGLVWGLVSRRRRAV